MDSRALVERDIFNAIVKVNICVSQCLQRVQITSATHPDQAYFASPNQGLSVEAEVLGMTITSLPPS